MPPIRSLLLALAVVVTTGCGSRKGPDAAPAPDQPTIADVTPNPTPARTRPHYFGRVVGLCVGIDGYRSPSIPAAEAAERDATAVARTFRERFGYETVELVGAQATRAAILGEIERLTRELGKSDALVVFFAGHGKVIDLPSFGRAGYLVPYDSDLNLDDASRPDEWAKRAIDMRSLAASTEAAPVRHVLFMVDACFSGFMARRGLSPVAGEVATRRSRSVLAATTDRQAASRNAATGHGHFTGALLERLAGRDAKAVTDLFVQVREDVTRSSKRQMLPQRGDFGEGDGEFVFIPLAVPAAEVEGAMRYVNEQAALRAVRRTTPDELYATYDAIDYRNGPLVIELDTVWRARFARFQANAAAGDPLALAAVAMCTAKGLGTDSDPAEAARLARLAYDTGRPEAVLPLFYCLRRGIGFAENKPAAERLVEGGLKASAHPAHRWLACMARILALKEVDNMLDFRDGLEEAAKGGVTVATVAEAHFWIQVVHNVPIKLEKQIVANLEKLAAADDPEALYLLYAFTAGFGERRAPELVREAMKRVERAAELGHPGAQAECAREFYRETEGFRRLLGLKPDLDRAAKWARYGAAQKSIECQKLLATMSCFGDGVAQDTRRARELAAEVKKARPQEEKWCTWLNRQCDEQARKKK